MATITKGRTFTNGELVTPATIHQLVDAATISGIVNADISASAAISDTKLAQITTANKVAQSAVTNLTSDLAGKALTSHTHIIANVTNLQMALDGKQASGNYAPATGIAQSAVTNLTSDLAGKAPTSHTHDDRYYTETEIDNKLSGLPVSGHTHTIANVINLQTALDGKQASGNYAPATGIAQTSVTNLTNDLAGKAPTNHTHTIANVTNLQTALDGKQASGSYAPATGIAPSAISGTAVIASDPRLSDARTPLDSSVSIAKLALATQQLLVPTGAIMPFAMNAVPTGWLAANGTEYSKTGLYAALFAAIGTTYGETNGSGGTGTTHFCVPDLCGYFVRGSGTNRDNTASGTFGAKQKDATGPHTHLYDDYYQATTVTSTNGSVAGGANNRLESVTSTETGAFAYDRKTKSQDPSENETRPKNIAMLYCIKF